ncbi:MAG: hypothetical protein IJA47_06715 [Oscillospiraceae bacterium]|nr:hypothetical protein [Oscillospiraceae bacterium]
MNKKRLALIIGLVVLVAALVAVYFVTRPATTEGMKAFTLEILHSDGEELKLDLVSDKEYLGEYLQEKGIIKGEQGQYGLYIQEVDGEKAVFETDGAYWAFYVGTNYATQGIDLTPIEEGGVYKLIYMVDEAG